MEPDDDLDKTRPAAISPKVRAEASKKAADPMIGETLGGCLLEERIGHGAMGVVYKATQLSLEKTVAVKTIRPEFCTDVALAERFQQEAKTIGRFSTPHVVMVHELGFEKDTHFLVMEYVPGGTLTQYAKRQPGKRLKTDDAVTFLEQCCRGLEEARELDIVHRDIKPDNLLLAKGKSVKIADWGIAKLLRQDAGLTLQDGPIGTPMYMSPEQCESSKKLDFRCDMYSLGASFYYLITGKPPAEGSAIEVIASKTKTEFLSPRDFPDLKVPGPLSRVIERITALKREDRYSNYEEVLAELADVRLARTRRLRVTPPQVEGAEESESKSKAPAIVLVVLLLAALGVGGWYVVQDGQSQSTGETAQLQDTDTAPDRETPVVVPPGPDESRPEDADSDSSGDPADATLDNQLEEQEKAEQPNVEEATVEPELPVVAPDFDEDAARATLAELRGRFPPADASLVGSDYVGWLDSLASDVGRLEVPASLGLAGEVAALAKAVTAATAVERQLPAAPRQPELPFTELAKYCADVRAALGPDEADAVQLSDWKAWRLGQAIDASPMRGQAEEILSADWQASQHAKQIPDRGMEVEQLRSIGERLAVIDSALRALVGTFEIADPDALVPAADLAGRMAEAELFVELAQQRQKIDEVRTIADWSQGSEQRLQELSTLRPRIGQWSSEYPDVMGESALPGALEHLEEKVAELGQISAGFEAAVAAFVSRKPGEVAGLIKPLMDLFDEKHDVMLEVVRDVGEAARLTHAAFQRVASNLELDPAVEDLRRALRELELRMGRGGGDPGKYVQRCIDGLLALKSATNGMSAVPARKVTVDGKEVHVVSFFIDRYECSRAQYLEMVEEIEEYRKLDRAPEEIQVLWDQQPQSFKYARERASDLREQAAEGRGNLPIEGVTYYEAQAFLRRAGKQLPTLEQWHSARASQGDNIVPGSRPVAVDEGGEATGLRPSAHHLAGNVREWLRHDGESPRGFFIGGSYEDWTRGGSRRTRLYNGKPVPADRHRTSDATGFRGMVDVRGFLSNVWPAGV